MPNTLPPPLTGSSDELPDEREAARLLDDEEVEELEAKGEKDRLAEEAAQQD